MYQIFTCPMLYLFMKREHLLTVLANVVTIATLITPIILFTLVTLVILITLFTLVILITLFTLVQGSDMPSIFWSSYLYLMFSKRGLLLREAPFLNVLLL